MASTLGRETPSNARAQRKDGQINRDHEPPTNPPSIDIISGSTRRAQTIDGLIDRRFVTVSYFPQHIIELA